MALVAGVALAIVLAACGSQTGTRHGGSASTGQGGSLRRQQGVPLSFPGYPVSPLSTTPGKGGGHFVAGVCRPSACIASTYRGYTVPAVDGSPAPYGSNSSPQSRCSHGAYACSFQIERPHNLSKASRVPAVIAASGTVSGDPQWIAASATDKFVLVRIPTESWTGTYSTPTTDHAPGLDSQTCGSTGTSQCDDIPFLQAILNAIECAGSPPCENVNPSEVYMEGASKGATITTAAMCDTRTSRRLAGISAVSSTMTSPDPTNSQSVFPNCPALLGVGSLCVADCVAGPINHSISMQWIYGTDDPNTGGPQGSCQPASENCLGRGFYNRLKPYWHFAVPQLATIVYGAGTLGCPTRPASTTTTGNTGKIITSTYTPCSMASVPAGTATQTVEVIGAQHLPEGTANGGDGISTPAASWSFWTTYPAH
jgi:poly(3-hydroxybutyrate) depolymerase